MSAPDEEEAPEAPESLADTIARASAEEQAKLGETTEEEPAAAAAEKPGDEEPAKPAHPQAAGRRSVRERRKLERAAKELEAQRAAQALAAQERAELEEARELRALRETDPVEWTRRTKLDLDKFTDGFLYANKPDTKVDALAKEVAEDKAARAKEKADNALAAARDEERKFKAELDAAAEEYPAIADMDARELFGRQGEGPAYEVGREIEAELKRLGYDRGPTNAEICAELNAREQEKLDKKAARLGYTKGVPATPARAPAAAGRTISRSATSQRAAPPPAADDFNRVMSSAERVEAMVQLAKRQAAG